MSKPLAKTSLIWIFGLLAALTFIVWVDAIRIGRVEYTSKLAQEPQQPEASSPTGYARGTRSLIVPEHNHDTYHWIAQTQQMVADGTWRIRRIDYENAPFGRDVHSSSAYRWWLGALAWIDHVISGRPLGQSVEHVALIADPLLHVLLLVVTAALVAWRLGAWPATLFSVAVVTLFPFAAEYLPGLTDERGLARAAGIWSVLLLLVGMRFSQGPENGGPGRSNGWFLAAGMVGGVGLWINPSAQAPVLVGVALSGLAIPWLTRRSVTAVGTAPSLPWRVWALSGAVTTLVLYLIEFAPDHLGAWELRTIHPLYAVTWLGLAEALTVTERWIHRGGQRPSVVEVGRFAGALALIAAVPVAMRLTQSLGILEKDLPAWRLARLPGAPAAANTFAWLNQSGMTIDAWATLLPIVLLVPAIWIVLRPSVRLEDRTRVVLTLGPVIVALGFAATRLSDWSGYGASWLMLLVASAAAVSAAFSSIPMRSLFAGGVLLLLIPGAVRMIPRGQPAKDNVLTPPEVHGLVERDLARWLALRTDPERAVVLAPKEVTSTLYFYGGLRGLGTLSSENQDGIGVAVRITSASTPEEAKELIERRGITHLVIPSWDSYLDVYARMGMGQLEGTFLNRVHTWRLPPWLRPVAYQVPTMTGFEGQSVVTFEVVEDQDDAIALSRVAEFFVETSQLELAASVAQALRRFPADLGAWVARAQVETARSDETALAASLKVMLPRIKAGGDRSLAWDRRVALAVVLARAKEGPTARLQVQRCLKEADVEKLRALTTSSLYRLLVLAKAFGLKLEDTQLNQLALDLLPPELRSRL